MLFWLLDHLDLSHGDAVYVAVSQHDEKQFDIEGRLKIAYCDKPWTVQVVPLVFQTRGAAETAFIATSLIEKERAHLRTVCLDCDTIHFSPILERVRELQPEKGASFYFVDTGGVPIYSYLRLEGDEVKEIREKVAISQNANVGVYVFPNISVLRRACENVLDTAELECYLSCALADLVARTDNGVVGVRVDPDSFECLGTPQQLRSFLCKMATRKPAHRLMRVVFDLDNTLVSAPRVPGDYSTCEPRPSMVKLAQDLAAAGHTIIIWTARRMRTSQGNVGAAVADVGLVTLNELQRLEIPYHEVHFGKPHADVYIDDLAVNALVDVEQELGWPQQPQTPAQEVPARSFHFVVHAGDRVVKSVCSKSGGSLRGECAFYASLVPQLEDLFPRVFEMGGNQVIVMEKLGGVHACHMLVGGAMTKARLHRILDSLERIHETTGELHNGALLYANYGAKLRERWEAQREAYSHLPPDCESIYHSLLDRLQAYEDGGLGLHTAWVHGDPVFTNIFLEGERVRFIDPRGLLGSELTHEGDALYDLAKVYQSLSGYDHVLLQAGQFGDAGELRSSFFEWVRARPRYIQACGPDGMKTIANIAASLLFSLIPLHPQDDRIGQYFRICKDILEQHEFI
jgi:capsule biosynthesis phosphatase